MQEIILARDIVAGCCIRRRVSWGTRISLPQTAQPRAARMRIGFSIQTSEARDQQRVMDSSPGHRLDLSHTSWFIHAGRFPFQAQISANQPSSSLQTEQRSQFTSKNSPSATVK